ncbi:MAG TPA: class I SAM-dependent methyltransferase [Myxococcota bacterium]|nr:class I SAM-dependent methyltransferase [Myxococcota bacterium]
MRDAVLRHYEAKYASDAQGDAGPLVVPTAAPRDRFEACVSDLPRRLAGGDVLEIAAGSGRLAQSLLAAGLRCETYTATELSEARLAALRRTLSDPRARVARLDLEAPNEEGAARYDAIILLALIEHLVDPLRAMVRVRQWLRPGGFAFVDTPNIAKWTRRAKLMCGVFPATASRDEGLVTYDGQPADLHDEGHLHYFTFRSLTRMLTQRCGFSRVERVPYASEPHLFGRRGSYALARLAPSAFSEIALVAYA